MKIQYYKAFGVAGFAFVMFFLGGCSVSPKVKSRVGITENVETKEVSPVTEMTLSMFKERIMDYEKNPPEWQYKGSCPAIIDFYATWCGPCKLTSPILDTLAIKYKGKVEVYKVDVDKEQELASMFNIQSIPAFLFIPLKGKPTMQVGAMGKEEFEKIISERLFK